MFHQCKTKADVKALYRALAKLLHPDQGGSSEMMILLTEARCEAFEAIETIINLDDHLNKNEDNSDGREFKKQSGPVYCNDEEALIFMYIRDYAESHKSFSTKFLDSVEAKMDRDGFISANQFNGLVNTYYSFRMYEKDENIDEEEEAFSSFTPA